MMNTTYLLMARFDKPLIPLVEFCEEYLGLSPKMAKQKFNAGELDLPIFRVVDSQKSPPVIRIQDLAEHLDKCAAKAKRDCNYRRI